MYSAQFPTTASIPGRAGILKEYFISTLPQDTANGSHSWVAPLFPAPHQDLKEVLEETHV